MPRLFFKQHKTFLTTMGRAFAFSILFADDEMRLRMMIIGDRLKH
jgi:hypothetical protein